MTEPSQVGLQLVRIRVMLSKCSAMMNKSNLGKPLNIFAVGPIAESWGSQCLARSLRCACRHAAEVDGLSLPGSRSGPASILADSIKK